MANINSVVSVCSVETEKRGGGKSKKFGLKDLEKLILISWREIFIERMPKQVYKQIENIADVWENYHKKSTPLYDSKEKLEKYLKDMGDELKNEIKDKLKTGIKENINEYYKIGTTINTASKNIRIPDIELDASVKIFSGKYDSIYGIVADGLTSGDGVEITATVIGTIIMSPLFILGAIPNLIFKSKHKKEIEEQTKKAIDDFFTKTKAEVLIKLSEDNIRKYYRDILSKIESQVR